ncbi:MAG: Regulator of chromosome condensation [Candidatus Uhrbacteria bacterium GW2011_GWE2_40_58]|nr:MAG: Regulator of chromosome condensation [Candidatus Uhrbacteria bacterium GW2011_GWF2_40_263]KKR67482.1 MAG: Regulator of chromosome condensation [Candidatus Uhrbacteria bacterium GW2011_GWE2_40_58]OGL94217.1 MAG: hypothetical protein A2239_03745 [Candidatus Uhrbacteria bacterium RIFOXYA2_FULL_40_9]OGL98066.1 MAG: hypothetical protein A2332_01650 [Candidatus Uhrbacteria bacterium RIFOXYB2_FULL_41_18]HBK35192.1 hypothetical protein [Candidatus Uhrbacteria bacterium]
MCYFLTVSFLFLSSCALNPFLIGEIDRDGDGISFERDCDDTNPSVGILTWYLDNDHDGFGNTGGITQCDPIDNYASQTGDCDDGNPSIYPDADEVCDGIDNNCDEVIDDDAIDRTTWYRDADQDTFGNPDRIQYDCDQPEGYVADNTDCDDAQTTTNPDASEVCGDLIDNDCDGETDTDGDYYDYYRDEDEDGYGDVSTSVNDCQPPSGYVRDATDCDDADPDINPGEEEICNDWIDNNCDEEALECIYEIENSLSDSVKITVNTASVNFGSSLYLAGDLDENGTNDLLIGSTSDDFGGTNAGAVSILYGPHAESETLIDPIKLYGEQTYGYAGNALATQNDMNGDGVNDFLIGSYGDSRVMTNAGCAYLMLGPISTSTSLETSEVIFSGIAEADYAGTTVLFTSSLDGDTNPDILIGAPRVNVYNEDEGAIYLFRGPPVFGTWSLADADSTITGEQSGDRAGSTMIATDLNGDGVTDLLIGSPYHDTSFTNVGTVYCLLGPVESDVSLSDADGFIYGTTAGEWAGSFLASANDTNEDGYDDLLIGAPRLTGTLSEQGALYLMESPLLEKTSVTDAAFVIIGNSDTDRVGTSATMVDINMDEKEDLLVGTPLRDNTFSDQGSVSLFYGSLEGSLDLTDADATWWGEAQNDGAGYVLCPAGDQNTDGYEDFAIGVPDQDAGGIGSGSLYLIFGLGM